MDPADANAINSALTTQGTKLKNHETKLNTIAAGVKHLTNSQSELQASVAMQVNQLSAQLQLVVSQLEGLTAAAPTVPAAPATPAMPAAATPPQPLSTPPSMPVSFPPVRLAPPEKFSGESVECRPFLTQCDLHFKTYQAAFASEQARVSFMVSHLTGRAAAWAMMEWVRGAQICQNAQDFSQALSRIFDQMSPTWEASSALLSIQQGRRRVVDYAIEFHTLPTDSGWNEVSIKGYFVRGLTEEIKDCLALLDLPGNFESLVEVATRIDNQRGSERDASWVGGPPGSRGHLTLPLSSRDLTTFPLPCLKLHRHLQDWRNPCSWAEQSWLQRKDRGG